MPLQATQSPPYIQLQRLVIKRPRQQILSSGMLLLMSLQTAALASIHRCLSVKAAASPFWHLQRQARIFSRRRSWRAPLSTAAGPACIRALPSTLTTSQALAARGPGTAPQ